MSIVPVAPLVAAVPVAPAALALPPVQTAFLPAAGVICVNDPDFAVVELPSVTVITVDVRIVPASISVTHIEPCTPALAAPGSNTTAVFGATVHVLPSESVTFVMLFELPAAALLSAAIAIAAVDPAAKFDVGEHVNVVPAVLCVKMPRVAIESAKA